MIDNRAGEILCVNRCPGPVVGVPETLIFRPFVIKPLPLLIADTGTITPPNLLGFVLVCVRL